MFKRGKLACCALFACTKAVNLEASAKAETAVEAKVEDTT
jgi:hypothetical protein